MDNIIGLQNIGNSCYLNSALQFILNCKVLNKIIVNNIFDSNILGEYKDFLSDYNTNTNNISPIIIKKIVASKNSKFNNNRQHDSHEYLIYLIDILEEEFKNDYKVNNKNTLNINHDQIINKLFDCKLSQIIYSQDTNEKSRIEYNERILSLSIPKKDNVSLNDCLDLYLSIEKMTDDNKWLSPKYNNKIDAYKKVNLIYLPKYLIIHLKRFSFFGLSKKNNDPVNVNINLNLDKYYKNKPTHNYILRSIIFHIGSTNGGHYVSVINKNNKWFLCNDSNISEIKDIEKYLNYGYIYLYVRTK